MKNRNKYIIAIVILLLLMGSGYLNYNLYNNLQDQKQVTHTLQDSQKVTFNKLGQATTIIATLQGDKKTLQQVNDKMYDRIKTIERAQRKKLVTATTFDLQTKDTGSALTTISKVDTVRINDSTKVVYPTYTTTILKKLPESEDTASVYKVTANKDSIQVVADIRNPIDLTQRWQREKIFGRKNLVTDVKTYNHNTSTNNLRSFSTEQPKQHNGIKIGGSILLGIVLGIFSQR